MERAVHFLDKFTFLTESMFGVQGAMTSYYQFYTSEEFSLNFDLHMVEKMKSAEDGFLLLLSSAAFTTAHLNPEEPFASMKRFDQKLNAVG